MQTANYRMELNALQKALEHTVILRYYLQLIGVKVIKPTHIYIVITRPSLLKLQKLVVS